jgi:hypothetical protein
MKEKMQEWITPQKTPKWTHQKGNKNEPPQLPQNAPRERTTQSTKQNTHNKREKFNLLTALLFAYDIEDNFKASKEAVWVSFIVHAPSEFMLSPTKGILPLQL